MKAMPILSQLVWTPFLGALLIMLFARVFSQSRLVAIGCAVISIAQISYVVSNMNQGSGLPQFSEQVPWVPSLGVHYAFGINGLGAVLAAGIAVMMLLLIVWSRSQSAALFAQLLLVQGSMFGVLVSQDLVLFYLFWEFMLLPVFFMVGLLGEPDRNQRIEAVFKFFLYTFFGAMLMLAGLLYLSVLSYREFGSRSFLLTDLGHLTISLEAQVLIAAGFVVAFLVKLPAFPLHTWFRGVQCQAPIEGALLFTVFLFQMGLYGLVQIVFPLCPAAWGVIAPVLALVGVVSIVYGALLAYQERRLRAIVAYSSVSHLGFCVLGVAAFNTLGLVGSVFHGVAHAVSALGILTLVGFLERQHGLVDIIESRGLANRGPLLAVVFFVTLLGYIALPLTNGFVGELLILTGAFSKFPLMASLATIGVVVGAVYMLRVYRKLFIGVASDGTAISLGFRDWCVMVPVLVATVLLGIYPAPVVDMLNPTMEHLSERVRSGRSIVISLPDQQSPELIVDRVGGVKANDRVAAKI